MSHIPHSKRAGRNATNARTGSGEDLRHRATAASSSTAVVVTPVGDGSKPAAVVSRESSVWGKKEGQKTAYHLASGVAGGRSITAGTGNFATTYSQVGLDPEEIAYDALDLQAQHLIDLLIGGNYTFANLNAFERCLLFRHFYKTNPVLGRIIDLHTDLPLSKTRLQPPSDLPDIAKDYIRQFYERVLERLHFGTFLREMVLQYNIYGEAIPLVDDYYGSYSRTLEDVTRLEEAAFDYSAEDTAKMADIDARYDVDVSTKSVTRGERLDYMNMRFQGFFEKDYTGPDRLSVIPFWKIQDYRENDDIDYMLLRIGLSSSCVDLLDMDRGGMSMLAEAGYSKGMRALIKSDMEAGESDGRSVNLSSETNLGVPYIFRFRRPEGASIIQRVLNEALEWEAAKRAARVKIESVGKLGRVVTAPGLTEDQLAVLRADVELMLQDPNYAIVANFEVQWQEVNAELKEQIDQIIQTVDGITNVLALGAGMPLSLLSGDSQYSGSSVKLEMLNVEYYSFKQRLQSIVEENILKPIALRKGFVGIDDWGNTTLYYPKLTFSRVSLRDESVFDMLFNLYQKGSLPVSIILDILNLDPDEVKRGVQADLFTINDPNFNEGIRALYTAATDDIYSRTDLASKFMDEMGLKNISGTVHPDKDMLDGGGDAGGDDADAAGAAEEYADGSGDGS